MLLYAIPYVLTFFAFIFKKGQLKNDRALLTPIQFEFVTWIVYDCGASGTDIIRQE